MKKFLGILVLGLLWCSECYANAESELHQNVNEYEKKFISTAEYRNSFYGPEETMNVLGWYNFTGEKGFKKNNERAIFWFEKASKFGLPLATYNLGLFYYAGLAGFEQSLEKAHSHFLLAYKQRFIEDKFRFNIESEQVFFDEMNKYNPNPLKEFVNLRDLFVAAVKLPSNQRYERLINLTNLAEVKDEKTTIEDFLNSKEIICSVGEIKIKIYTEEENAFILRAIFTAVEDMLEEDEFFLSYRYAKKIDGQIEWFNYDENDFFGTSLYHYKVYFDQKNQQLRLYIQPYDITGNKKLYLKIFDAYKILKKEKLSDIGGSKHIELEVAFFNDLYNNYKKLKKTTDNNGESLTENYLCEI